MRVNWRVFKRIYIGALNVKWFGAKGDDSINDVLFINNCISTAISLGVRPIIIPEGIYLIDVDGLQYLTGITNELQYSQIFARMHPL